jgi:hypothetical protein
MAETPLTPEERAASICAEKLWFLSPRDEQDITDAQHEGFIQGLQAAREAQSLDKERKLL